MKNSRKLKNHLIFLENRVNIWKLLAFYKKNNFEKVYFFRTLDHSTQTQNFDSLKAIRNYRKRNRQLEIALENVSKKLKKTQIKVDDISEQDRMLKNAEKIVTQMLHDERLNSQNLVAKLNEIKYKNRYWQKLFDKKYLTKNNHSIKCEELQEDLENSKRLQIDYKNRLHVSEISQAKMLRRVKSAEAKLLEASMCQLL